MSSDWNGDKEEARGYITMKEIIYNFKSGWDGIKI